MLEKAKTTLYGENTVAFLGPPNSGKTIIATLLNDAIFNHFLKKHAGQYDGRMTSGFAFIKTAQNSMLAGKFPSATVPNNEGEVVFSIKQKGPMGKGIQLKIRDMSGEDYNSFLISGDLGASDRTFGALRQHKTRTMPYGPLSFIVFAKVYAVTIDCSLYDEWRKLDLDYAHLLDSLLAFQEIRGENGEKITAAIAIILTKADCLPDDAGGSASALVASKMGQFNKTLQMLHSGPREYFKTSIDPGRTDTNKPIPNSIKVPLSYSSDEYNRLLSWIIKNVND